MLTHETMYQALVDKDIEFEGSFITGVKTTGIFCRPTCTARKPKIENVEFFKTVGEAMAKGYRPCKICNPLEKIGKTPPLFREIVDALNADPSLKFKEADLIARGIEPSTIRRWFLKNHGVSFNAFQRMLRINTAFKRIQRGEPVSSVAFDTGFESLSGFNDSFKSVFGVSPVKSHQKQVVDLIRLETPLGTMIACGTVEGICLLEFSDRKMLETELKALAKTLNAIIIQGNNPHFDLLQQELAGYFAGHVTIFTVPLVMPGTDFQQLVWQTLQKIPFGATRSYRQQAAAMDKPSAVRAVASANGRNRIAIIIPCHRVIGEAGSMTGYSGGIWRKQWLLNLEKTYSLQTDRENWRDWQI